MEGTQPTSMSEKLSSCSDIKQITIVITVENVVGNAITMTTAAGLFLAPSLPVNLGQSIATQLSECEWVGGQGEGAGQVC